jgi:hypothetical protein
MKRPAPLLPLGLALAFSPLSAAPSTPSPIADPPELVTLRGAYESALTPLRTKLEEGLKNRSAQYAADIKRIEDQATASNHLDGIPPLRAEREAVTAGDLSVGFPKDDRKVPSAGHEARRAFDRDITKLRSDINLSARPLLADYSQKLDALERQFQVAKNTDGILAVRREKQVAQAIAGDPLGGIDGLLVGVWQGNRDDKLEFKPGGKVKGGSWSWTDRVQREARIDWNGGTKLDLTISADGEQMTGKNSFGQKRSFKRLSR